MISNLAIIPNLLRISLSHIFLKEDPIPEIHLGNLTDWGWVLFLSVVILVVWILIIIQAKSKGSHKYGLVSETAHDLEHPDVVEIEME